jgi:hypothetical protein
MITWNGDEKIKNRNNKEFIIKKDLVFLQKIF